MSIIHRPFFSGFLSTVLLFTAACSGGKNLVANPDFELGTDQAVEYWQPGAIINTPDHVQFKREDTGRSGKHSIKITNSQMNDSWIIQNVMVASDRTYRVSGWIKTENLQTLQGSVGATVCLAGGIIRSTSVKGTQPWTQVEFYVKTAKDRTVLPIACSVGLANSNVTGSAWFDDIEVQEVNRGAEVPVY